MEAVLIILTLALLYCAYQLIRNQVVYEIRKKWIINDDKRIYKYTYDYMFVPRKENYFGLQYPREINFQ